VVRYLMTTVAQVGLPKDPGVLRALVLHNRLSAGALHDEPCAGVYATVERHGRLTAGAPVTIA